MSTWTWLSLASDLVAPHERDIDNLYKSELRLDSWDIAWKRQPYVSELERGLLFVSPKAFESSADIYSHEWRSSREVTYLGIQQDFRQKFPGQYNDYWRETYCEAGRKHLVRVRCSNLSANK